MNYEADEHTSCIIAGSMERKIWWRSTLRIAVGINILVKRDNMRTGDREYNESAMGQGITQKNADESS